MPWSMVHFAIANKIFQDKAKSTFLLGSIAPDAVLVREKENIDKLKSHLYNKEKGQQEDLIGFYQSMTSNSNDDHYKHFILGYISHIYADIEWDLVKKELINQVSIPNIRQLLWDEENQNDFYLYQHAEWKETVIKSVLESPLYEISDIYSLKELDRWRHQVFNWFENEANEPKIQITYINNEFLEQFINVTANKLKELFELKCLP